MDKKKVAFYTLGCKLNFSESSTIARQFEAKGYQRVDFGQNPDIFIINTCSVTDHADKKCKKIVQQAKRISPHAFVAIIGCYAQLKPEEIAQIPGVDVVLGAAEKFQLLELIDDFKPREKAQVFASPVKEAVNFVSSFSANDRTRTFLKVQDGCNYHCAFCTIPLARGKSRSASIEEIINQAEQIAAQDVKEVVLTGVNIGDYGIINGRRTARLLDLVQALEKIQGIERFRISSIEPNLLTNELIDFVAQSEKFVDHFHIPLQSGNDKILTAMRRRYLSQLYAERIAHIKSLMPNAGIGVDVITGFPGETAQDFLVTYEFLNQLPVTYLHAFTYSERPNTDALKLSDIVPIKERQERTTMLRSLSEKKQRHFYQENMGKTAQVLFEHEYRDGQMYGLTSNYIRVAADFDPMLVNELVDVQLVEIDPQGHMRAQESPIAYINH